MRMKVLAVLLPAIAAGTTTAPAQDLMLGAYSVAALGTTIKPAGGGRTLETALGAGGGVRVGYAITPRITAYAGLDVVKQDNRSFGVEGSLGLTHLEAGARLSVPVRHERIRPWVSGWVARRRLSTTVVEDRVSTKLGFSGTAFGLGAGAEYFIRPGLAVDGGLSVGIGKFGSVKLDDERIDVHTANSTTTRLSAGLSWYPNY